MKYGGDSCLIYFPGLYNSTKVRKLCKEVEQMCRELDEYYRQIFGFGFSVHGGATTGSYWLNIVGSCNYHLDYYIYSSQLSKLYNLIEKKHRKGLVQLLPVSNSAIPVLSKVSKSGVEPEMFLPNVVAQDLQGSVVPAELRNAVVVFLHLTPPSGEEIPIQNYQQLFLEIQRWVYEFGGVINKIDFTEKGYIVLILFGVPHAHMDDIERAFLCSQRIIRNSVSNICCRIGITHSNIYCGFIGSTKRWEYGIIGNAVNVAARLLSFAKEGQIALTEEIVPVIESRFAVRYVESTFVRGLQEPIRIYLLDRELPEHWARHEQQFSKLPFVLGTPVQNKITTFSTSPHARVLCIIGAQGTGKSYIVWLVSDLCNEQGKTVEVSVADKSRQFLRLEFFFNLLRRKLGIISFRQEYQMIHNYASERHLDWNDKLVYSYLFPGTNREAPLTKEETDLAIACLTELCAEMISTNDVFAVDNLDVYDAESLTIIQRLTTLFLATGKKVVSSSRVEGLLNASEGFASDTIKLTEFKYDQTEAVISEILPLVSKSANNVIHKISNGNPQFLVALLKHISGFEDIGKDLITESTILDWQNRGKLSDSLENLLMSEYQSMASNDRQLLKLIAIYGRPFTVNELTNIFKIEDIRTISGQVSQLVKLHILELFNRGGNPVYAFANPLLQDCIYRSILLGEKRNLHLMIAKALIASTERQEELLQSIVHHYLQAEDIEGFLKWSTIAADKYFDAGAWNISKFYYRIISEKASDPSVRSRAILKMAEASIILADNAEAKKLLDNLPPLNAYQIEYAIYLRCLYLNNIADYSTLQQYLKDNLGLVTDPFLRPLTYNIYLESLLYSNDLAPFFREALKAYSKLKDTPVAQNRLAGIIAQAYMNQGEYKKAAVYYRQKLAIAEELADGLSLRIANNGLGTAFSRMGKKQKAFQHYQTALSISERDGDRNGYAKVLLNLGVHHRNLMEYAEALACYEKSLMLSRHIGNLMQESITLFDMGELLVYQNRLAEAKGYIQQSLDIACRINDYTGISFCHDALGDLYFKNDDIDNAEKMYTENLILQRKIHDIEGIAHTWGNLGNIAKKRNNYPEARKLYYRQLKIELAIQDLDGAGRARFNLAMINRELKMYKRAMTQLICAKDLFTKCNAQYYLDLCKQQESELLALASGKQT
jgi:tetratricopeptide (TPR) repeat protein